MPDPPQPRTLVPRKSKANANLNPATEPPWEDREFNEWANHGWSLIDMEKAFACVNAMDKAGVTPEELVLVAAYMGRRHSCSSGGTMWTDTVGFAKQEPPA